MLKKLKLSTVVCGCFVAFSAWYLYIAMGLKYWSSKYAPGPGFIPRWIGGLLLVLSVIALIQSFKRDGITMDKVLRRTRLPGRNLFVCWGGLVFFMCFVKLLGFVTAGSILMIALFQRGTGKWKYAIPSALLPRSYASLSSRCFFRYRFRSISSAGKTGQRYNSIERIGSAAWKIYHT